MTTLVQSAFAAGSPLAFATPNVVPNTAGNFLAVVIYMEATIANPSITCSDLLGNVYQGLGLRVNDNATAYAELFIVPSCLAGINEVTGTVFDGATPLAGERLLIHEFTPVPTFYRSVHASGTGLTQSSGPVVAGDNSFLFGYEMANITSGQTAVTPGVGWTQAIVFSPAPAVITQYKDIVSAGNYDSTTTSTVSKGSACHWVAEILAFDEVPPMSTADIALTVPAVAISSVAWVPVTADVALTTPAVAIAGAAQDGQQGAIAMTLTKVSPTVVGQVGVQLAGALVVKKASISVSGHLSTDPPGQVGIPPLALSVNAQTGTAYTIQHNDRERLVTFLNSSPVAVTVPEAVAAFGYGWRCAVHNKGAGTVTITPSAGKINEASNIALTTGQGFDIVSDGKDWQIEGDLT
jgi:hypothetical protein